MSSLLSLPLEFGSSFVRQPFFHIIASTIAAKIGEDKPVEIIVTTLVAFALSSVLTGTSLILSFPFIN